MVQGRESILIATLLVIAGLLLADGVLAVVFAQTGPFGVPRAQPAPPPVNGITGWLLMQAGMNMASVVGLLPVTGVTLPLISFGGSSLIFTMGALGLLLSIARQSRPPKRQGTEPGGDR
jgi:hypothetical protein